MGWFAPWALCSGHPCTLSRGRNPLCSWTACAPTTCVGTSLWQDEENPWNSTFLSAYLQRGCGTEMRASKAPWLAGVQVCLSAPRHLGWDLGLELLWMGMQERGLCSSLVLLGGSRYFCIDIKHQGCLLVWVGACQILPSFLPLVCNAAVCYLLPSIPELAAFLCHSEVWKYFEIFIQW